MLKKVIVAGCLVLLFCGNVQAQEIKETIITITIPDGKANLIYNSFSEVKNRPLKVENEAGEIVPNPETKAEFTERMIVEYISKIHDTSKQRGHVKNARVQASEEAVKDTEDITVGTEDIIEE